MNASLRLTRELIDQIVFGMENQDREYVLDTEEANVLPAEQAAEDPERYIPVPDWKSVDGYNLMEQFVATLHNPIFRERLRAILASGRGVFRQFKDTIRERREVERLWFHFKERRMRELVTEWFNDMRERDGLVRLESLMVETETDQLVESDFVFRHAEDNELELVTELDAEAFGESFRDIDDDTVAVYHEHLRAGSPPIADPRSTVFVVETQGGEFAGFLWAITRTSGAATVAFIQQLYVTPDYRGFGLARNLFDAFCREALDRRISEVHISFLGSALDLEPNFIGYGLERRGSILTLDVDHWRRSEAG